MNDVGDVLAAAALVTASGFGIVWLLAIRRVRMGAWLPLLNMLGAASLVLGSLALRTSETLAPRLASLAAIAAAVAFFAVRLIAKQPRRRVAVGLGDRILDFVALDGRGAVFETASLHGSPYLLKFYRGHW